MALRIRLLAGCFAFSVTGLLLTGAAAQAAPQSGAHVSAVSQSDHAVGIAADGAQLWTPTPTPTMVSTPSPSPSVTATVSASPTVSASATPTAAPTGGAGTGGGGSTRGGSNLPLAAGGAAVALVSAGLGLLAFRRWRRTRLPAA